MFVKDWHTLSPFLFFEMKCLGIGCHLTVQELPIRRLRTPTTSARDTNRSPSISRKQRFRALSTLNPKHS